MVESRRNVLCGITFWDTIFKYESINFNSPYLWIIEHCNSVWQNRYLNDKDGMIRIEPSLGIIDIKHLKNDHWNNMLSYLARYYLKQFCISIFEQTDDFSLDYFHIWLSNETISFFIEYWNNLLNNSLISE